MNKIISATSSSFPLYFDQKFLCCWTAARKWLKSFGIYYNLNNADLKTSIVLKFVFIFIFEDEAVNCEIETIKKVSLVSLLSSPPMTTDRYGQKNLENTVPGSSSKSKSFTRWESITLNQSWHAGLCVETSENYHFSFASTLDFPFTEQRARWQHH